MHARPYRLVVVGAASLRGKELKEALDESTFQGVEVRLLDQGDALGQLEAVGDEVTFIHPADPAEFEGADFVFFAGSDEDARKQWRNAQRASSTIVDLSGGLEGEPGSVVRAPWIAREFQPARVETMPDLRTSVIVVAHPAAVALALVMARLRRAGATRTAAATLLHPASEFGRGAMDELHQQTVSLLSFQQMPKEVFDAQTAFNMLPVQGAAARVNLADVEKTIARHYVSITEGRLPIPSLLLVQAPTFHGITFSLFVELEEARTVEEVEQALGGEHVDVTAAADEAPTNINAAGQEDVIVRVRSAEPGGAEQGGGPSKTFWIWGAIDNLRISAWTAVECANSMRAMRPRGQVQ